MKIHLMTMGFPTWQKRGKKLSKNRFHKNLSA